jgi:parallel beta-helix repeat protein
LKILKVCQLNYNFLSKKKNIFQKEKQQKASRNTDRIMLSTLNYETKQGDTNAGPYLSYLVQPNLHGKGQRLPSLKVLWIRIFSYSGPTKKETPPLRCLCKLFTKALKPLPCWTSYPHPKYSSLRGLFGRINELSRNGSTNIPKLVLIDDGIHDEDGNYVDIRVSISIVGESREHCVVIGGLRMKGKKEDDVNVSNLTLRKSKENGVFNGFNGASMHLDNVSVENSEYSGVYVYGSKRNTMKNCNASHSKYDGLSVSNGGLMTIDGNGTTIHHNNTGGFGGGYGLHTHDSSSSIHLVSPLTKEMISTNNHNGKNYRGTIQTITNNNTKEEKK